MEFIGRTEELTRINEYLNDTKYNRQCTTMTVIAETGVGKSRLVQEFYNQLTKNDDWDPEFCNYWPDAFQTLATQLHVTPTMTTHEPKGPPKFLWFGLRWHDPRGRNPTSFSMLPLLLDQLETHAKIIQSFKERWRQALEKAASSAPDALRKAAVDNVAEMLLSNFIPGANLVIELVNILRDVLQDDETTYTVDDIQQQRMRRIQDELLNIFRKLCEGKNGIPIVIWLDDAQWMDSTSYAFLRKLQTTAVAAHWPIFIVATCWPEEWNQLASDHFLKRGQTLMLANPPLANLREYLTKEFPGLTEEQVTLIIYKSADNYLGLIENIGQLRSTPRFFVNQDFNNQLSDAGIRIIERWDGNRALRIAQRFSELDDATKDVLARASVVGQTFLQTVIHQFAHLRNIAHTDELLDGCIDPLVLINQLSPNSHIFRDRGYYFVAQQHFDDWLSADELNDLLAVLTDKVGKWVHGCFSESGEINERGPLSTLNYVEQQFILQYALQMQSTNHALWLRGVALCIETAAQANDWEYVKTITQHLTQHDWRNHDYHILDVHTCEHLIMYAEASGNLDIANRIADELVAHHRALVAQSPTPQNLHDLTLALNNQGNGYIEQDQHEQAIVVFEEDAQLQRQLFAQTNDPKYKRELSVVLNKLGNSHARMENNGLARAAFQESIVIMEELTAQDDDILLQRDLSFALLDMAQTLLMSRQPQQSSALFERAIHIRERVVQADPSLDHQLEYAYARHKRSFFTQDYQQQQQIYQDVIETHKQVVQQRGTISDIRKYLDTLLDYGHMHQTNNALDKAIMVFTEAGNQSRLVLNRRGILGDIRRHRDIMFQLAQTKETHAQLQQSTDAESAFLESLQTSMQIIDKSAEDKLAHVRALCGSYYHFDFINDDSKTEYLVQAMNIINDVLNMTISDDVQLNLVSTWYTTAEVVSLKYTQDAITFLSPALIYMRQHKIHSRSDDGRQIYESCEALLAELNKPQ